MTQRRGSNEKVVDKVDMQLLHPTGCNQYLVHILCCRSQEGIEESRETREQSHRDIRSPAPEKRGHEDSAADGGSALLLAMLDNFRDQTLQKLLEKLDSILTESTVYTRNSAAMRHQVNRFDWAIPEIVKYS